MAKHGMAIFQFYPKCCVWQGLNNLARHLYRFFFRHLARRENAAGLEIRFFKQALVLMTHDVIHNLRTKIHGDDNYNQQTSAPKIKWYLFPDNQELR